MSQAKSWTPQEDETLRKLMALGHTFNEAAERIGRTRDACKNRAKRLGAVSKTRTMRAEKASADMEELASRVERLRETKNRYAIKWTPEEDAIISEMRKNLRPMHEIAAAVGRSTDSCDTRLKRLNVRIRKNYLRRSPKWRNVSPSVRPTLTVTLLEQRDALGGRLYIVSGAEHAHIVPATIVKLSDWAINADG